jgi:surfeit locus 1 family protein
MSLGFWQLHRADEKKVLLEESERMMQMPPVAFDETRTQYVDLRYQRVVAKGHFEGEKQFLLDNQVHQGRVGYHVLTPFILEKTGRWLLVDRGWISAGQDRRYLPDVSVTGERMEIMGTLYVPFGEPYLLGEVMDEHSTWPRLLQAVDWNAVGRSLDAQVAPVLLRMDQQWDDGLVHEWELIPFGPQKHIGYAFQWFAMALALFIMSIAVYYSRRRSQ